MLPALAYQSLDEFEDDYIAALVAEASELAADHRWWCQPFALAADPQNPSRLAGSSKLMHRYVTSPDGTTRPIPYRDDVLMAAVDTLALFERLALLSQEHEFSWQILLPSEPRPKAVGRITEGAIEPRLFELIMPELDALNISEAELSDTQLHQRLHEKHFPDS